MRPGRRRSDSESLKLLTERGWRIVQRTPGWVSAERHESTGRGGRTVVGSPTFEELVARVLGCPESRERPPRTRQGKLEAALDERQELHA